MGGGLTRKKGTQNESDTSGYSVNKRSGPDSSRTVTGLPLRVPSAQPAPASPASTAATRPMAGKEDVFQDASNIFVVLGASVSGIITLPNVIASWLKMQRWEPFCKGGHVLLSPGYEQ